MTLREIIFLAVAAVCLAAAAGGTVGAVIPVSIYAKKQRLEDEKRL